MDTAAVRASELTPENTEVVGLNGKLTGYCGYSLPVVRHKPTGLCCVLSLHRKPGLAWTSESETREMVAAGRATQLERALSLPPRNTGKAAQQPVVAWVLDHILGAVRQNVESPILSHLIGPSREVIFCAVQSEVEDLFSEIVRFAQVQFDTYLASPEPEWRVLSEIAEIGLQAAREVGQKYWMYIRRCVALYFNPLSPPELAYQIFRVSVEPTYKGTTWARFLEGMGVIYERALHLRRTLVPVSHLRALYDPASFPPQVWRQGERKITWQDVFDPRLRWAPYELVIANPPYGWPLDEASWRAFVEQMQRTSRK